MTFAPLRGFRDYLPPEAGARSELRAKLRAAARRCGFQELETPCVEGLDLYRVKSGEEIVKQTWAFTDKGDREVALTPESTPSLARIFVDRAKAEPLPVKWFTIGKLWRYEEPQAGRTREFLQFNLDILGVPGITAEGEILAAAALALDEAGAAGLYCFRLFDRALTESIGRSIGVRDNAAFFRLLDRYRKTPSPEFERSLRELATEPQPVTEWLARWTRAGTGVPRGEVDEWLDAVRALHLGSEGEAAIDRLKALFRLIDSLGLNDRVVLDPTLVRGFAYYTTTVFEAFDRVGDHRALFGGGRYDRLIELFGGPPTPACGLAIGDQTLELLLRGHGRWPMGEPGLDTYVIAVTAEEIPTAVDWVQKLRRSGVSADSDLMARSLSRQLKEANRRKARRALIVGPAERARGVAIERDLSTGSQREIPMSPAPGPA